MIEAMESSMNAGVDRSGVGFTPMHHHNHHSSCGESSEEELSVLPRHTKVVVTGNNRTKSVLVGLEGVVKKAVGLGGWHWLVLTNGIEVKLQRNALSVLEPPTGNEDDDEFEFESDEDINDQEPNTSSNVDEDMEEGLVHKDPSIYGKLLEKLEHSHKETYKRRKLEARKSQNTEEDSSNYKQEAFHLLNKCDTLDGIIGKSGRSNALQTEDSENEDKDETFQASLSDEGDESDAASDDPEKGCSTVGTTEASRGGGGYKGEVVAEH